MVGDILESAPDEDVWKRKYYDSLAELDSREREAGRVEAVLRDTVARMCVVVGDTDEELEADLDELRRELRGGAAADNIAAVARRVADHLVRLERKRSAHSNLTPAGALLELLNGLDFSGAAARRAHALKKRLSRLRRGADLAPVMGDLGDLLREHEGRSPGVQGRGGWLSRWTGRSGASAAGGGVHAWQTLLDQLQIPGAEQELAVLRHRLGRAAGADDLDRLAADLTAVLNDVAGAADQPAGLSCNEAMLRVLERLEFPDELDADAKALHDRLEQAVAPPEWPGLLTEMADLIGAVRRKAQLEKRELEEFLAQLTSRLEEIDQCLGQMDRDRNESLDNGRMLDAAVQEHVRGIHSSVESAAELDQLKQSIEQRLEAIGDHMEQYRRHEETRNAAAEQHIAELNQRLQTLEGEASELRDRVGRERRLALVDRLTGAYNRMAYEERVAQEFMRWQRFGEPLSLAIVDIDDFKRINDSYGHKAGDKVLSTIGQLFRKRIRATDFLARYGGEEFVILMPGADREAALAVVEHLRREVEDCGFHHRGDHVAVTISCGVADFSDGDRPDTVFDRADAALYEAKDSGKNRCSVARG